MAKPAAPKPGSWEALNPETLTTDFNQWPNLCLSSYGPVKEQVSIISGIDTSPEELHCFALDDVSNTKSLNNFHSGLQAEIEKASFVLNQMRNQNLQVVCQQLQSSGLDHASIGSSLPDIPLGPHSVKKASTFSSANVGFMKPGYVPGSYGNQFDILNKPEFQLGADVPKNFTQPTRLFGSDSQLMKDGPKTFGQVSGTNPQLASTQNASSQPAFPTQPAFGGSSSFQSNSGSKPAAAFGNFSSSNIGFNNNSFSSFSGFGQSPSAGTPNIGFGKPSFPSASSGFGQTSFPPTASTGSGFGQASTNTVPTGTGFSFAAGLKALGKTPAEPTPQETSKPPTFTSPAISQQKPKTPEATSKPSSEQNTSNKPAFAPISTPFSFGQPKPVGTPDSSRASLKTPQDANVDKQPAIPQKSTEQSNAPAFSFKSAFDSPSTSNKPAAPLSFTPPIKEASKTPVTEQPNITKTVTTDHGTASFIRLPKSSSDKKSSAENTSSTPQPVPDKASTPLRASDMLQDDLNRFKAFEKEFSDLSLDSLVNKLEDMMNVLQVSDFESHPEGTLPLPTPFLATEVSLEENPELKKLPPFPFPRDPKQAHSDLGPPSAYSAPNTLEPWEIEAFKRKDFIDGVIPSRPPTIDLLFHK